MKVLDDDRKRGFSTISEMYAPGMSAMAAPVLRKGQEAVAVITIAGPIQRLTSARMLALGPALKSAAAELAMASIASPLFAQRGRASGTR
jgi:DNA-binding IclR family transcriptional regulator